MITIRSYDKKRWSIFYYRDDKQTEIDVIVETDTKIMAIEIKWSDRYRSTWKQPLETFANQNLKKPVELIILYRGQRKLKDGQVLVMPFEDFLKSLSLFASACFDS